LAKGIAACLSVSFKLIKALPLRGILLPPPNKALENAEYHAAREQQSFVEGRIGIIEGKLAEAQVIDITQMPETGRVIFGTTVTLENADTGETMTYQIVGDDEADIKHNKISCNAPLARAIIAKEVDEEIDFTTPDGKVTCYAILKVEHI
jgi:transcription elongation factor GreA